MSEEVVNQIKALLVKVNSSDAPQDLKSSIKLRLDQLSGLIQSPFFLPELDRLSKYIEWAIQIPWNKSTKDILDLEHAIKVLDEHHYGLDTLKDRILEYISIMKLKEGRGESEDIMRAPILCFVGLVGTGKTTISKSIAEALGRKFTRIPFGGMGSPLDLRGQSRSQAEAEPGKVIKALVSTQAKNPVILLDEIDRVTDDGRASLMGVLVELLDPEQNNSFVDHYLDYPVDLSGVLFIATANNTHNISTAVMDRLEPIMMPSYSDKEKIAIAKDYMFPRILSKAGIDDNTLTIDDDSWAFIVRPLGFDAGIRTLERTVEGVVRKVARMIVEGKGETFHLTPENVKQFLPQL
jgi:ATP-dependent Lon protease